MRFPHRLFATTTLLLLAATAVLAADARSSSQDRRALTPLGELDRLAREQANATARIALTPEDAAVFRDIEGIESTAGDRVPNYLRVLSTLPHAAQPLAHLFKTVLYSGAVEPETKMAMGVRIAQIYGSPYAAAHLQRFLSGTERGRAVLLHLKGGTEPEKVSDRLALRYAENLTRDIHGVSDQDFREVRGAFNDGQIVELTLTVCFFNHFIRFTEALNLPLEPWVFDAEFTPPSGSFSPPMARVALISDEQMGWAAATNASRQEASAQRSGLGLGLANSQRAMFLSPEIAQAWRSFGFGRGDGDVSREIKLHVSFAVSMANGCRYCTLHQVQGLRRLNVSPTKLMQMKKDDSALTPRELAAVEFARKLTRDPASVTDTDYDKLRKEFGEQGSLEVVLQTCAFAFMNRFTDGLHLPSEDAAIQTYREVYGGDWTAR